ncbi:hypothetical protein SUNI508_11614 [Seiridium unicorne]|uniref:C3H1-type domain-containing protein n=1 Tax=Seiridium unicorne TaxID=138068 RepID=A0ABR2UH62_9PEZI
MAQGGHNWPGGQFHANGVDHNGAVNSNDGALGYGDGLGTDSEMMYMNDWGAMNQSAGSFGASSHGNATDQQFYQPQSYYQPSNTFNETNRPIEQRNSTASPSLAYGNGMFHDPSFQRPVPQQQPQQQQQYQQLATPDLSHHNPQSVNFVDGSWQGQAGHPTQTQYGHQSLGYESQQNIYQQHLRPASHSHTPTPPPAQRNAGQLVGIQSAQPGSRPNVNLPGNQGIQNHPSPQPITAHASQYQFQVNQSQGQARNSPYQNVAIPAAQSNLVYPGQVRYAQPHQPSGQNVIPAPSPQPPMQQQHSVYPMKRTSSATQQPMGRTDSPIAPPSQASAAPSAGLLYPHFQHIQGQPDATGVMQQGLQTPPTYTIVPSQPPFDPIAHGGFIQLVEAPNLFVSDVPIDAQGMEIVPEESFSFSAHFNARDGPLIPIRQKRLPCEIRRDWKWLRKQEKSVDNDAKRRAILLEKDRLDREMVQLTGEYVTLVEPSTKITNKKAAPKSGSKLSSARKTGSESSDDSSEYESDSDLEESKEDQEARKIKLGGRPSDPVKAVEFDVIQAVWRGPEEPVQANATATAIQAFGVHIEKLWNKAKDLKKEVKAAKEKKSKKLDSLDAELTGQLKLMRTAIETATKFAEPSVLENMGGNAKLAVILWNALRSSIASKDFNGPLPKAILFLMSHFVTMEKSLVVGVLKVSDYQKKYQKEFDKICNAYLDQIQSKAKGAAGDAEKRAKENAPANGTKEAPSIPRKTPAFTAKDLVSASKKPASAETKKAQPVGATVLDARKASGVGAKSATGSPSKRPRDDDLDSRATKKVAVDGSGMLSVTKPTTTPAAKITTVVQPRPKSSGSILPGRARPTAKPAAKKVEPQQSSSLSTISGLLAEIAKPKSPPRQKDEPTKAPETEEEKRRRIRKEARRGLRVMWKPDQELEEVRIFQHDAAEDEGRASNMVRDARDNRSEGQALKRARVGDHSEDQEADAEKDDEENDAQDGKPKEITLREWADPGVVNVSHIDEVNPNQRAKTFLTRGGSVAFHTDEQKSMEKYEQTQLMAIYTSLSDIPETPKSPLRKDAEKHFVPQVFQLPTDMPNLQETHARWTEIAQFGANEATHRMIMRLRNRASPDRAAKLDRLLLGLQNASMSSHDRHQPYAFAPSTSHASHKQHPASSVSSLPVMSQSQRDEAVVRLLKSEKIQRWIDANQVDPNSPKTHHRFDYGDAKIQADVDAVESVAATFAGKPYPAAEPPEHLRSNPAHVKEWQAGYAKAMADRATQDATDRAKKLAEEFSRTNVAAGLQPASQPAAAQPAQDPNAAAWAAYFAQMNQNPAQPSAAQGQQLTHDQYAAILQQTQALQAQHAGQSAPFPASQFPTQQQPAQQDPNGHIGALLAALGGQASQPQPPAPVPQPMQQDPNAANAAAWAAYYASIGQAQPQASMSHQQPQTQQQSYQHRDRDRNSHNNSIGDDGLLDYGPSETESRDKSHRGRKDNRKDNFRGKDYDHKGINRSLIGTKPCTFWAQGKCAKGDQCTFRHDPNDLVK